MDRYGRTVARVTCNGTDANAEQVRAGMHGCSSAMPLIDACMKYRTGRNRLDAAYGETRSRFLLGSGEQTPARNASGLTVRRPDCLAPPLHQALTSVVREGNHPIAAP
jgi:hypothetical protein